MEGKWVSFSTGRSNFSSWAKNKPNNLGGKQHCAFHNHVGRGFWDDARWNYHSCARHLVGYSKLSFPKIWYIPLCRNKESFEIYTCNNIFFSMKHWYEMKLLLVGSAFWRRKSEIQWKCSWLYEIIKCGELCFFFKFYNYKVC